MEKIKDGLSKLSELWPILVALVWLIWMTSSFHQETLDQMKTQEDQIKAIQDYLRHTHAKYEDAGPISDMLPNQQDAKIPFWEQK